MSQRESQSNKIDIIGSFDLLAPTRDSWIERNRYYHQQIARTLAFFVPANSSILEIGSGTGEC